VTSRVAVLCLLRIPPSRGTPGSDRRHSGRRAELPDYAHRAAEGIPAAIRRAFRGKGHRRNAFRAALAAAG
jgi:hypothetical protein